MLVVGEIFTCSNCGKNRKVTRDHRTTDVASLCRQHDSSCWNSITEKSNYENSVIVQAKTVLGSLRRRPKHLESWQPSTEFDKRFKLQFNHWSKGQLKQFITKIGYALPKLTKGNTFSKQLLVLLIAMHKTLNVLPQPFSINQNLDVKDLSNNTMETMVRVKTTSLRTYLQREGVEVSTRTHRSGEDTRRWLANRVLRHIRGMSVPMKRGGRTKKKKPFNIADVPAKPESLLSSSTSKFVTGKKRPRGRKKKSSFFVSDDKSGKPISKKQKKEATTMFQHAFKSNAVKNHGHGQAAFKNTLRASHELNPAATLITLCVERSVDGTATGKPILVASKGISRQDIVSALKHLVLGMQGDDGVTWLGTSDELATFTQEHDEKSTWRNVASSPLTGGLGAITTDLSTTYSVIAKEDDDEEDVVVLVNPLQSSSSSSPSPLVVLRIADELEFVLNNIPTEKEEAISPQDFVTLVRLKGFRISLQSNVTSELSYVEIMMKSFFIDGKIKKIMKRNTRWRGTGPAPTRSFYYVGT